MRSGGGERWRGVVAGPVVGLVVGVGGGDARVLIGEEAGAVERMVGVRHLLRLASFPAVNLAEKMLFAFLEEVIRELPSVRHNLSKTLIMQINKK